MEIRRRVVFAAPESRPDSTSTTIKFPAELYGWLKIEAYRSGVSVSSFVAQVMEGFRTSPQGEKWLVLDLDASTWRAGPGIGEKDAADLRALADIALGGGS